MATPEKASEQVEATRSNPTEGGVSAAATREGQIRQVDQALASLDERTRQKAADAIVTAAQDTKKEETSSPDTLLGAVSSASSVWEEIAKVLGEAGVAISDFFRNLFDFKKEDSKPKTPVSEEGSDPDQDDDSDTDFDLDVGSVDRAIEDSEMLTPNAPVFSFAKVLGDSPPVTDVPRIRHVHPVTKQKNVPHEGVDIGAKYGTPLYATTAMTYLGTTDNGAAGLRLNARLQDGTVVSFLHLSKVPTLKKGDTIPRGGWIANTGNSGRGTGPHLHFEINYGESGDPIEYLDPGLVASAERKIDSKKASNEWTALEGLEHDHA